MTGASGSTDRRGGAERAFDLLLGLSLAGWAVHNGWRHLAAVASLPNSIVQGSFVGLSLLVGFLIASRSSARAQGGVISTAQALPTVFLGGWVTHAVSPGSWGLASALLAFAGAGLAAWAFITLGKSFAVLPSVRGVVSSGPYRFVRHPAYGGELLVLAACCLAEPSWLLAAGLAAGVVLIVPRIAAEERLLNETATYRSYRERVSFRLVPAVY